MQNFFLLLMFYATNIYGYDLLDAVINQDKDFISYLIDQNVNINSTNSQGMTALHLANDPQIAQELILYGANINALNNANSTPLQWAVSHQNQSIINTLLEYGVDINHQDTNGNTALHLAAKGSDTIITLLIQHGANINISNNENQTPLQVALTSGYIQNVPYLSSAAVQKIIDENSARQPTLAPLKKDMDQVVLKVSIPPSILAIFSENYKNAFTLIEREKDVNIIKDEQGNTLLHWAILKKHRPLIRLLLLKNADTTIKNNNELSAMDILQTLNDQNLTSYVERLIIEQKKQKPKTE